MFKDSKRLIFTIFTVALLFLSTNSPLAIDINETNNVMESNNLINSQIGIFDEIQKALDNAKNGDTITLDKAEYLGSNKTIYLNKSVNIVGASGIKPILNGNHLSRILFLDSGAKNLIIQNCEFVNAYLPNAHGGAIYVRSPDVKITDCVFRDNEAKAGAAIYTDYDRKQFYNAGDNMRITNCKFYNNLAYNAAGAVGLFGNNSCVLNCVFDSNKADNIVGGNYESYGGAIQLGKDNSIIISKCVNCLFTNNIAVTKEGKISHGGAGCVRDGIEYKNCTFIGNSAGQGGALTYHSSGVIDGCNFINNTALVLYGGALSTGLVPTEDMNLLIKNSKFQGNTAPYGGACYLMGFDVTFYNTTLTDNSAKINGGGIYIKATSTTIENSIINDNTANCNGGGIYINATSSTIINNEFNRNEAIPKIEKMDEGLGGAIYINSSKTTINNNIFNYNTARNGSAIYIDKYSNQATLNNNIMFENQAWIYQLPVYVSSSSIMYGETIKIGSTIHGGNNIARFLDLPNSNAIYNGANVNNIIINGVNPVSGATESGKLYQDDREYNTNILLTVINQDGRVVYNETLFSNVYGEVTKALENLDVGVYTVYSTHKEDNYYKGISNKTSFTVTPKVDVQIQKTAENDQYNYKDYVLWNLTIKNAGPNDATEVILNDLLPKGLTWIKDNSEGKYNPKTGILTLPKLSNQETFTLLILTQVNAIGDITNYANVSSKEYDYDLENNNDSESIYIPSAADLAVVKTVDVTEPEFNDKVTWTISVSNNGPCDANGVVVSEKLPEGIIWLNDDSKGAYDYKKGIWTIGKLANGQSKTLKIICLVNKTGKFTNIVNVSGNEYDYNMENNKDSKSINVQPSADLEIIKTVNNTSPNYKDLVKWTVEVRNNGPDVANGVVVSEDIPDGLVFVNYDSTIGVYNMSSGLWSIGSIAVNSHEFLNVYCLVNKTGTILNFVSVVGDEYDWNKSNNNDSEVIDVPPSSDLEVIKTVDNANPNFHDLVKWTVEVRNNGPDTAHEIRVNEILPIGLEFVRYNSTKGSFDIESSLWTMDLMETNTSEFLYIYCTVNKTGKLINLVSVDGKEYDWNTSNNNDLESIEVPPAVDLAIEANFNNPSPNYKDEVILTLTALNNGPDNGTGVKIYNPVPEGLILISESTDFNNGTWNIGNLSVGEIKVLNLRFIVNKTGEVENPASIEGSEFDYYMDNNYALAALNISPAVDLQITKTASKYEYSVGYFIDFTVKIQNNGPDTAHNIIVSDFIEPNMFFAAYSADVGSFDDNGNKWSLDKLGNGQSATLHFKAIAKSAGVITNRATVSCDEYDWNISNNMAQISVLINNIEINKSNDELDNVAKAYALEKAGNPIVMLVLSLMILLPFSLNYFNRK